MCCAHSCTWAEISRGLFGLQDMHTAICEKKKQSPLELQADWGHSQARGLASVPVNSHAQMKSSIFDFLEFSRNVEQS